jgi:AraC family transcriptional regulator
MKAPLTLDYGKENASLKILASDPLLSKRQDNSGMQFEYHEQAANYIPEHVTAQNALVILHKPSAKVNRFMGDKSEEEHAKTGDVVFIPAGVTHSVTWDYEAHFSLLLLEPQKFSHTAYEFIDPDKIVIVPQFAQFDPVIYSIGQDIKRRLERQQMVSQTYFDAVALFLSAYLLENHCTTKFKLPENTSSLPRQSLQQVIDYIQENIDKNIGSTELAGIAGVSRFHFTRQFKRAIGESPHRYIVKCRLKKAQDLLAATDFPIKVVAKLTGFATQEHFCNTFRRHLSTTPQEYRKKL